MKKSKRTITEIIKPDDTHKYGIIGLSKIGIHCLFVPKSYFLAYSATIS